MALSHSSASRLACSKARRTNTATSSKNFWMILRFSWVGRLTMVAEMGSAPLIQAVDFLDVAQEEKGSGNEFEPVLDGKLLVDGVHHGEDFLHLAARFLERPRDSAKKCAMESVSVLEKLAPSIDSRVLRVSCLRVSMPNGRRDGW